jgi:hypothetical protein
MESKPKRFADALISAYFCLYLIGPINILESIMCMSACFHRQAVSDCVLRKHGIYHVQTVNSYREVLHMDEPRREPE